MPRCRLAAKPGAVRLATNFPELTTLERQASPATDAPLQCERRDSNPDRLPYQLLRLARLPVPPRSRTRRTVSPPRFSLQCSRENTRGRAIARPRALHQICDVLLNAKTFDPRCALVDVVHEQRDV